MKSTHKHQLVVAALAGVFTFSGAQAQTTPDSVNTRIGAMKFERGYPTEETARKLFDELDYQRAVQAYLWAYPAVSFESIRLASKQAFGADYLDLGIADKFVDPKSIFLTANDTTIYAFANIDLGKSGPVVVEVPPGAIVGLIDDFWQRSATDVGLPGPHGDKGGKFLLLPPGYKGEVPKSGYEVLQATMNNYNIMVRGIVTNLDKDVPQRRGARPQDADLPVERTQQSQAEQVRLHVGQGDRHAAAGRPRILGAPLGLHQQQPGPGARPLLHGDAQAAGHREGQAVQP